MILDLEEFLTINLSPSVQSEVQPLIFSCSDTTWSHTATLTLIDLYKQYRDKVGTFEIRNLKNLWELIATQINSIFKSNFTPSQIENRWRVLERNYKKVIDNNKKTGRGHKSFTYEKEMDEIYGKKRNINPELLLDTDTVHIPKPIDQISSEQGTNQEITVSSGHEDQEREDVCGTSSSYLSWAPKLTPKSRRNKVQTRNNTLELMRQNKNKYYEEIIKIQRDKLAIEKQRLEVMKVRTKERQRKDDLIEERNKILKLFLEKNIHLPDVM